ncbi:integrase [Thiosulfatimonas sediminis]|uniref:Integrase n=1 Tax=Thiosulfatimonas sediminis TaxID=2675054 RepID=A0A6F8PTX4_9GAMM|nr:tyrosine-type recombinase/integrase [Thiosulfatimonas sediminis]BBP45581.1 integrase [Thiosulfatimonas sediminis]
MPLTDTAIRKFKPEAKRYRKTDSAGLIIEVMPNGNKVWRYRFQFGGKATIYTIGDYPAISLAKARQLRDEAKALVAQGINPKEHKETIQAVKQAELAEQKVIAERITFTGLFELWHEHNAQGWTYDYAKDIRERIESHLLPLIGHMPAEDIKPKDIIHALKLIEAKGIMETMKRSKQYASRIFRYGVGMGHCEVDPVRDLPTDICLKQEKDNFSHITERGQLYQLLNALDSYTGDVSTATALKLAPHVFLRPNELAGLRWDEIDLDKNLISISAERMKMKRPHMVPLSKQAKALIESMQIFQEQSAFVFPSPRTPARPINGQSLNAGLHRIGFKGKQTAHGFRHTASTLLNELGFNSDHIEKQLAHEQANQIRGVYNKAEYLPERSKMMQAWSNHLDALKSGGEIIPINRNGANAG